MSRDEFFKMVGILMVCFFIIYMTIKMFQLQTSVVEGLTNKSSIPSGEAGTSASYAAAVKSQVVKLQDELLVSKYRKDYEEAIIHMDDYVGYLMLQQVLNVKMNGDVKSQIETMNQLNTLKSTKDSLNAVMSFLDKQ